MFLASRGSSVRLIHRGRELSDSMSQYLVERLRHTANVKVEMCSQVIQLCGDDRLRTIVVRGGDGVLAERAVGGLFVMIGADPCTEWLKDTVQLDDRGFILTGADCDIGGAGPRSQFETSLPGVFAVGDVRSGSVKRVASAVGEGSVVVQAVHARLASLRESLPITV
jgi:thioredoxin reductase (NADPH)